jgi:hypothetical protein
MVMEKKFIRSPRVVIFNINVLMQQWKSLLPVEEPAVLEVAIKILRCKTKSRKGVKTRQPQA